MGRKRSLLGLLAGGVRGDRGVATHLAHDLHGDLYRVGLGKLGVELGPRLVVHGALEVERLVVELLGPVRADGGEDGHDVVGDAEVKLGHAIGGGRLVEVLARGVHDLP